ncbi:MAG: hypothetical protein AAFR90_13265 [Pseudomonadota bacterium]
MPILTKSYIINITLGVACGALFWFGLLSALPKSANKNTIRIVAPLLPPQIDTNGTGREAEIISAAISAADPSKKIEFHIMPFTRHWQTFKSDFRFDAVTTVPDEIYLEGIRSASYIQYQNGVFFWKNNFPNGLGNKPLKTLERSRIVSFAGSTVILPQLTELSQKAQLYIERANQLSHSIMFKSGFVDIVIADELIFEHYTREIIEDNLDALEKEIYFAPIFCPTEYRMVFRSLALREIFDIGLKKITSNGVLEQINKKYQKRSFIARASNSRKVCVK